MCLTNTPDAPAPTSIPQPVREQDAATRANLDSRRRRLAAMSGYRGTILTGPSGNVGGASPVKTLLGE